MLQFVKRFNDIDKINTLSVATLLDPRFKTMYLEPLVHERTAKIVTELIIGNEREFADPKPDTPPPVPTGSLWDLHDQLVVVYITKHIFVNNDIGEFFRFTNLLQRLM